MNNDTSRKDTKVVVNKNKIKQSALCCIYCGKSYKAKLVLDKHLVLCEVSNKTKSQTNNEDETIIPSQKQMYQIIIELALKCSKLENKVNELTRHISKKINKINIIDYLNNNISMKPTILFDNINEIITVEQSDIEYLFHNSFIETLNTIMSRTICQKNNDENSQQLPIATFVEKPNTIYIYTNDVTKNDNTPSWMIAPREKIIRFLNIIQLKISKSLSEWRKKNVQTLNENDSQSILYDKTFSKLIGIEFKIDGTYNKFYNNIYHKIKKELNVGLIE